MPNLYKKDIELDFSPKKQRVVRNFVQLNCGMIEHNGKRLYCYRRGCGTYRLASTIWITDGIHSHQLKLPSFHGNSKWVEDPRLFHHNERLFVCYADINMFEAPTANYSRVRIAEIKDNFDTITYQPIKHDFGDPLHQKNWQFFSQDGELYCVYSIMPHRIMHITLDGNQPIAKTVSVTSFATKWAYGELRGGTPPIRVGDEYYSFFHSSCIDPTVTYNNYVAGCYAFDSSFRVKRCTEHPILESNVKPEHSKVVVFPCGAILSEEWNISYGYMDDYCRLATYDRTAIENALVPVIQDDTHESFKEKLIGRWEHRYGANGIWEFLGTEYGARDKWEFFENGNIINTQTKKTGKWIVQDEVVITWSDNSVDKMGLPTNNGPLIGKGNGTHWLLTKC